jgi:hypothetical protein
MNVRAENRALKRKQSFNENIEKYKLKLEKLKKEYYLKGYNDALKGDDSEYELDY